MSAMHFRECARIWRSLGCDEDDEDAKLSIETIAKHSRYLSRAFPELLERFSEVAVRGAVAFPAFQALYLGRPAPRPQPKEKASTNDCCATCFTEVELRALFDELDVDGSGEITLSNVVEKMELIQEKVPEMLTKWSEIDTNDTGSISWEEFRAHFGGDDQWLEIQLNQIVGLEDLKEQIRRFYRGVLLDKLRRQRGLNVGSSGGHYHMIFQGNPGTGKTSLARLMAKLLHRVGIAPKDTLVEVQQEQLVAGYVGQTATKTQKVIDEAVGGLLFIDEAYRLSQGGGSNDFGKEAIEQLMSAMNESPDKAPIMVFAGYPVDMEKFMAQNDGLYRRIPYTFKFSNYSCSELAEMLEMLVIKKGFCLEDKLLENGRQSLARVFEKHTLPQARSLMNGGICERLFSLAKQSLDLRDDPAQPSVLLCAGDIIYACQQLPPPPGADISANDGGSKPSEASLADREAMQALTAQIVDLQGENGELKREVEQLKREAAQGGDNDVLNATMIPSGLQSTCATELQGIRALLKEVRRLKAEAQARDEELRIVRLEKESLVERLEKAEAAERFAKGVEVEYFSASLNRWIDAIVAGYSNGKYDLDVKKNVAADRIRRRQSAKIAQGGA